MSPSPATRRPPVKRDRPGYDYAYSHSQMTALATCPRKYRNSYEEKIKTKFRPGFFVVGDVIEEVVNGSLLAKSQGFALKVSDAEALFDKAWEREVVKAPKLKGGQTINWKNDDPAEIRAKLRKLAATVPTQAMNYFVDLVAIQARIERQTEAGGCLGDNVQPRFMGKVDYLATVLRPKACPVCQDVVKQVYAEIKSGKRKKMTFPKCETCRTSLLVPDFDREPVKAVIDCKTAAQRWNSRQALADGQAREYVWTINGEGCKFRDMKAQDFAIKGEPIRFACYLVGVKSANPFWQFFADETDAMEFAEVEAGVLAHDALAQSPHRPRRPGYAGKNCDMCDFPDLCWNTGKARETLILP